MRDLFTWKSGLMTALIILVIFSAWSNTVNLRTRNAVRGFSPVEHVHRAVTPEEYPGNFENGVANLDTSLLFRFYTAAWRIGIGPESFQRAVIVLGVIFFALALWYFSLSVLPRAPSEIHILAVMFGLATDVYRHGLANFSLAVLSSGQAYAPSAVLTILAFAFAFRKKWLACSLAVGTAFCFHAVIGAIAGLICCAIFLSLPERLKNPRNWGAGLPGVFLAGAWFFLVILPAGSGYPKMEFQAWLEWARFGNAHWFPFSLEVFGTSHQGRFTPLASILLLALTSFLNPSGSGTNRRSWAAAVSCAGLLTIAGLIFSVFPLNETLVKLSLHRTSMFIILLCLPPSFSLLVEDIKSGKPAEILLALFIIISAFSGSSGFPFFFAVLRFGHEIAKGRFRLAPATLAGILLIILAGFVYYSGPGFKWIYDSLLGRPTFILFALFYFFFLERFRSLITKKSLHVQPIILLCLYLSLLGISRAAYRPEPRNIAYLETQLWAARHTSAGSLFMTEPLRAYGWRDHSRRPSFGVAREWLHTSWLYTGNEDLFREGMRRARLFGVEPDHYLARSLESGKKSLGPEYQQLIAAISAGYNSLLPASLEELAKQEGINYFVFEKSLWKGINNAQVIFENDYYAIVKPSGNRFFDSAPILLKQ